MGAPGFDNAEIEKLTFSDKSEPQRVTMIYPYYENPVFMHEQLDRWEQWTPHVKELVQAIIVDDGSPKAPAESVLSMWKMQHGGHFPFNVRLFRIGVDVRWNWLAARNIGMFNAPEGWCTLTDMDHVIPEYTMAALSHAEFNEKQIYTFRRKEHGREIHRHPNSMFMTREMFWKVGGYDEALSGHYGTDGDWRRRCAATAPVRCADLFLERHEYVQDSSTTTYLRKQPEDAGKKRIIAKRGPGWRPRTLSFVHHEVTL